MLEKSILTRVRMKFYLRHLLTERQVARGFGVSTMTIFTWRTRYGLPAYTIPGDGRPAIRYDQNHVTEWAKEHGKPFHLAA